LLQAEVQPHNILLIGPTGSGKTEIARRIAKITQSPYTKADATKFTETGIVGADVDDIIQDLVDNSISLQTEIKTAQKQQEIAHNVEEMLVEILAAKLKDDVLTTEEIRKRLRAGEYEDELIMIQLPTSEPNDIFSMLKNASRGSRGRRSGNQGMKGFMPLILSSESSGPNARACKVKDARGHLLKVEQSKFINKDELTAEAIRRVESDGIVFLDEIDKLCGSDWTGTGGGRGSRGLKGEGVQKELLGLLEGSIVQTQQGPIKTNHILFIAAGAFHSSAPSDLMPEMQGRLPIRVELQPLTQNDFYRILTETEYNLIRQQVELLKTEGLALDIRDEAIQEIAKATCTMNANITNIGARRIRTVLAKVLEEISFKADKARGETVVVDAALVRMRLQDLMKKEDHKKFIL
jgi:ATP-dependent HslUV protease ATP-binding subunit HslU